MRSRSILASFNHAIDGVVYALRTQRNMRIHVGVAILVLIASLFLRISRAEFLVVLIAIVFVIGTELVNTAVEAAIDVATDGFDPLAKVAKDVAAGSVLVSAIGAAVVGYVVFFARLASVSRILLVRVRETPSHLTVVALGVTGLAVLIGKAISREGGTWLKGGWPSGHAALASAAAVAIAFVTTSVPAGVLAGFIAALVIHSRVESKTHTLVQALWGTVIGVLITALLFQLFWS